MKIKHIISLAIFTIVLLSCSKEKNYTVENKDGVLTPINQVKKLHFYPAFSYSILY